jgi:ClpP class serine protease
VNTEAQTPKRPTFAGQLAIDPRFLDRFTASDFPRSRSAGYDTGSGSTPLPYARANGVAVVEIDGPLCQRGDYYWYDSHESITARCLAAAADPAVRLGALRIDSPGGVVAGCFDGVRAVRAAFAAAGKPLLVWAGGDGAYSAGYAWACAGSKIFIPDTAGVGSIGVLSTMYDRVAANELEGYRVVVIRSGERKAEGHPDVALTDGALGREQVIIDAMAEIFAGDICAPARDTTGAALLAYQGECFYGATAVQKGLADGVMPWEDFLALCETEAKGIMSKAIAARLGIAESATEQQIINAIGELEAKLSVEVGKVSAANERADKLAADYVDAQLETAHREGRIVASEKEAGAAGGLREMGAKDPAWLRAHLSTRKPLSALPVESRESKEAPENKGASTAGKTDKELAEKYEALSNIEREALAKDKPADFTAMRSAWRNTKGPRASAHN